jgi:hypothetical protein
MIRELLTDIATLTFFGWSIYFLSLNFFMRAGMTNPKTSQDKRFSDLGRPSRKREHRPVIRIHDPRLQKLEQRLRGDQARDGRYRPHPRLHRSEVAVSPKETARSTRLEVYASWLADDVDGLVHNLVPILGERSPDSTTVLAEARAKITTALAALDTAIAADRAAHAQEHA